MVHGPVREVVRGPGPLDWSTDRGSVFSGHPNLRAECDVNNEAKILRIEIVFATLKPAVKSETVECKLH